MLLCSDNFPKFYLVSDSSGIAHHPANTQAFTQKLLQCLNSLQKGNDSRKERGGRIYNKRPTLQLVDKKLIKDS